ncbi:glycosyl hydrolase family 8 [Enterococcus canintestini]|uniref:glycosyl hydrolase family 8 n=1 Tax=Enterococcus canintestini TaxID=317010 RepID=UPI0028902B4C|nr:glycosyl hydrolase family 8 [Enterococcus canintestini]MDT2739532.1 glycosyl hydrolase family 8 [Enterococcus canintestini]
MKKKPLVLWGIAAILLVSYVAILFMAIKDNRAHIQQKMYDDWREHYLVSSKQGDIVNTAAKGKTALSEAQGYGMVIVTLAAEKGFAKEADFEKLYRYYTHYQISEKKPLMQWRQAETKKGWGSDSKHNATDGDLDIAYSLLVASKLWPNSKHDYKTAAQNLLQAIKAYNYNPHTGFLTVGDWATVDEKASQILRPSDIMPGYFDAFYKFTGDRFWQQLNDRGIELLQQLSAQHKTGLMPDFAWIKDNRVIAAKANEVNNKYDGDYSANACRIPLRLAQSNDKRLAPILSKMLRFFEKENMVFAGYNLKGKALVDYQNQSFSAPVLVGAYHEDPYSGLVTSQKWVIQEPIHGQNYYDETLKVLSVLEMYKNLDVK